MALALLCFLASWVISSFQQTLNDPRFIEAFGRQLLFTGSVLVIEIPLGIMIAKGMPRQGKKATAILLFLAEELQERGESLLLFCLA